GIQENKAQSGLAVAMNPKTGAILAMCVLPSVNPNEYHLNDPARARNRVVSDVFEPGSVFKVVTASALFENNLVAPDTRVFAENGKMNVVINGRKVRTVNDTHEYGWITFQEAIEVSSNIVMAKLSKMIGSERFYRTARAYGFGIPTGIDVPGEIRGVLKHPSSWSGISLQTMAYGYEVGVTPLQILSAYAAVANDGVLMKPCVVGQVRAADGTVLTEAQPQALRRVVSHSTVEKLMAAFEGVVERGTAKEAKANGVRIAGKTGTSRKYVDGKYETGSYTASFVGFFPVEDPQVACLVMMDNPKARGYYGGITSGPVFRAIAQRIVSTSSRFTRPTITHNVGRKDSSAVAIPDVRMVPSSLAEKMLEGCGLNSSVFGKGDFVMKQSPEPGKRAEPGDVVTLILSEESTTDAAGNISVPDVRGMSVRRAMNRLAVDEFKVRVQGAGVVVQQLPTSGQKVKAGAAVVLVCQPRSLYQASLY
ncbi:MAG: PASTA domain-containing protein, partial [Ignavibacteriales bacterium]|nr:PASTA domain-containing protein [Ignavibacteriales bacterium]